MFMSTPVTAVTLAAVDPWVVAAVGAILGTGGAAAVMQARSQSRNIDAQTEGVNQETLTKMAAAVEDIYSQVINELRQEVDHLLDRYNRVLTELERAKQSEQECRAEVLQLRADLARTRLELTSLSSVVERIDNQGTP